MKMAATIPVDVESSKAPESQMWYPTSLLPRQKVGRKLLKSQIGQAVAEIRTTGQCPRGYTMPSFQRRSGLSCNFPSQKRRRTYTELMTAPSPPRCTPAVPEVALKFQVSTTAAILPFSLFVFGLGFGPVLAAPLS